MTYLEDLELPTHIRALAKHYTGDSSGCKSPVTKRVLAKIEELTVVHPTYSSDDGEIALFAELGKLTLQTIGSGGDVPAAIEKFLDEALTKAQTVH